MHRTKTHKSIYEAASRSSGYVTNRTAMDDLDGMTSATLASRICEMERVGYEVQRDTRKNPVTGRRYTRYYITDTTLESTESV